MKLNDLFDDGLFEPPWDYNIFFDHAIKISQFIT